MKNFEKYENYVLEIADKSGRVAIVNGKPEFCDQLESCNPCLFGESTQFGSCTKGIIKWLYEEYKEGESKLTANYDL